MEKSKKGCGCEADLKKEVKQMVNEVEGYTKGDRTKKEAEVKAAFDKKDDKKQ